ncbi:MAG: HEAT repeat domain-containing protein [Promethearchaeota archaeon]
MGIRLFCPECHKPIGLNGKCPNCGSFAFSKKFDEDVKESMNPTVKRIKSIKSSEALYDKLDHPSWSVRRAALQQLAKLRDPKTAPYFIDALTDNFAHVRQAAAEGLGVLKTENAVPFLLQATEDTKWWVRKASIWALGEISDSNTIPTLVRLLSDPRKDIRLEASQALAKIKNAAIIPHILQMYPVADVQFKVTILRTLGEIGLGTPEMTSILLGALEAHEKILRIEALRALRNIPPRPEITAKLIDLFKSGTPEVRHEVIETLNKQNPDVLYRLIPFFSKGETDVRRAIIRYIPTSKSQEVLFLSRKAIKDVDREVRKLTIIKLTDIISQESIELLLKSFGDKDESIRLEAAKGIVKMGKHAVVPILMLLNQEDLSYKKELMSIFSQIKDKAMQPFKEILSDFERDPPLRRITAQMIGKLRLTALAPVLDNSIRNDPDWVTRYEAALALGKTGTYRVADALKKGLGDDSWAVRRASVSSLGLIGDKSAADSIITCLTDEKSEVRKAAVSSLRILGCYRCIDQLTTHYRQETDEKVRKEIIRTLADLGQSDLIPFFEGLLTDPDWTIRYTATIALGKVGGKKVTETLNSIVNDKHWRVREVATKILKNISH